MKEQFSRTALLVGDAAMERLFSAHVAVFGLGGVGGYVAEALTRAGVGALTLCDSDTVSESNLNRQIFALHSTVGMKKTEAAAARLRDINPNIRLTLLDTFFLPETADGVDFSEFDYVVDAVDTVAAKMELIRRARAANVPILSACGTGNKLDPSALTVTELEKTSGCPLARVLRGICRKEGIRGVRVVYSRETPAKTTLPPEHGRHAPGSTPFVPAAAGLLLAATVVRDLTRDGGSGAICAASKDPDTADCNA